MVEQQEIEGDAKETEFDVFNGVILSLSLSGRVLELFSMQLCDRSKEVTIVIFNAPHGNKMSVALEIKTVGALPQSFCKFPLVMCTV